MVKKLTLGAKMNFYCYNILYIHSFSEKKQYFRYEIRNFKGKTTGGVL